MKDWINLIYIGLMTGILGGLASGYIVYNYKLGGLTCGIIFEAIILTLVVGFLCIGGYWFLFERKGRKPKD